MKKALVLTILLMGVACASVAQTTLLDSAKVLVASNRTHDAIPILDRLLATDASKAAHNYFLGLSLVREGIRVDEATTYLEKAAAMYATTDVDPGMGEPELVHFYLVIAYCRQQQCDRALQRYYELVDVYSGSDPFYTKEAVKWVEMCNEPQRMAQEVDSDPTSPSSSPIVKDRLVAVHLPKDSIVTRTKEFSTRSVLYGVQVGALARPTYTVHFPQLRNVGVYVDENGIYRYVIGNLTLRSQAEKLLQKVRAAGYPDAFIVDINNPERYREEVVLLNELSIQRQLKGDVEFRVQIGAFSEVLPERLAQLYLELDDLRESRSGEMTLLTTGNFPKYDLAAKAREQLVARGFSDAFVTAFNHGQRVPVDIAIRHQNNGGR